MGLGARQGPRGIRHRRIARRIVNSASMSRQSLTKRNHSSKLSSVFLASAPAPELRPSADAYMLYSTRRLFSFASMTAVTWLGLGLRARVRVRVGARVRVWVRVRVRVRVRVSKDCRLIDAEFTTR